MAVLRTGRRCAVALLLTCVSCSSESPGTNQDVGTGAGDAGASGGPDAFIPPAPDAATADGGSVTDGGEPRPDGLPFPDDFVFGTAIAGFQADMGCPTLAASVCDDARSDWYAFTTDPLTVRSDSTYLSGENPSQVGPGFWELYEDDIARIDEELHHGGFRFSLEWSRIFPNPTDEAETAEEVNALANRAAVQRYHDILAALKRRNIKPLVTLYHYSLPVWIHDAVGCHDDFDNCSPRGWVDAERTLREAQKYAAYCAREFGAEIDWWATLNEPLQNMLFGYVQPGDQRSHPPAVSLKTDAAKVVFNALIDAHARMYDAVKMSDLDDADGDGQASFIGVVYPLVPIVPNNPDSWFDWDDQAAANIDYLWNRAFLNAVALGQYDANLDRNVVQREDLAGRMDYVGVNYYFGIKVSGVGVSVPIVSSLSPLFTANPLDFKEIPNDPAALKGFLHWVNDELGVPALISENGVPDPNDDGTTAPFLVKNLRAVQEAITEGADVRGYFYWTLMDNYEWNHGMEVRMGLYAVDKNDPNKRRVPRKAVPVFAEIARHHVLPTALLDLYGN